jgi:UDP-N-acetylmuramate: L-alanyl-gamma-D-glutamyl-meso-diaminopimelate ligase
MNIHILSIAGTMTTPLALALVKAGHTVTGSDQVHIYPPFSQMLLRSHIPVNPDIKSLKPDLVIVGSAFNKFKNTRAEFNFFKNNQTPYISATQYIATKLIKSNSILVAGSYGKTTITAALSWVFTKSGLNPSYFFGGQSLNRFPSLKLTDSLWSITEADESINGLDSRAKFLYYPVKYLILTSAHWEHKESYPSSSGNTAAFAKLIKKLPKDGLLVYNHLEPSVTKLVKYAQCPSVPYNLYPKTHPFLFGQHNQNNLDAVITLCSNIGLNLPKADFFLQKFKGIKRRLELLSSANNIYFYDDFAQNPFRINACLSALKMRYPQHRIISILNPHASFLQQQNSLNNLDWAFKSTFKVFLEKIHYSPNSLKTTRSTLADYKKLLGDKLVYLPLSTDLISQATATIKPGDIVIRFSSGGLTGLRSYRQIINKLKIKPTI